MSNTKADVFLCPECGSAWVNVSLSSCECEACEWKGEKTELVTYFVEHQFGSDENILKALLSDMKLLLAKELGASLAKFLNKWGFLGAVPEIPILKRYVVAASKAMVLSILEERKRIEGDKIRGN